MQRAFVSFSNNPIMSGIKLIGSGKFIFRENALFDLKYDLNSGPTPIDFLRLLIIFGPNLVSSALCRIL